MAAYRDLSRSPNHSSISIVPAGGNWWIPPTRSTGRYPEEAVKKHPNTQDPLLPLPLPPLPTTTIVFPLEDSSSSSSGRRPRFSRVCQGSYMYDRTKDYCFVVNQKYSGTKCWSPWDVLPIGNWINGGPTQGSPFCGTLCMHQAGIYSPNHDYCYQSINNPALYFWTSVPIDCTQSNCRQTYPHNCMSGVVSTE